MRALTWSECLQRSAQNRETLIYIWLLFFHPLWLTQKGSQLVKLVWVVQCFFIHIDGVVYAQKKYGNVPSDLATSMLEPTITAAPAIAEEEFSAHTMRPLNMEASSEENLLVYKRIE